MKTRYLSNKIKNDKYISNCGFPDEPKFSEVELFLLDHGFKKYNFNKTRYSEFADLTERRFGINKCSKHIEVTICDRGKTTEDNPEFTLYTTEDGSLFFAENLDTGEKYIAKTEIYTGILEFFNTYEEFLDKINKSIMF